ncbi:MAG: undecaprenyl/decaprenyl-phosphate alpha-N-acetylglucosaminyl 1-phosphate transferase, partial [Actinomycetota bacterium]|nr:undecaprenyl/decaprenyl-phosphate alpha-N-acetylglucosaminyl 1-phosphate transferase [Actinomycetota bacterium]
MGDYLGAFVPVIGAAALVTVLATPAFRWLSFRTGAVVAPDERRVHTRPLAVLGGAAILLGVLAGLAVGWQDESFGAIFASSTVPLGVALGAIVIFGVGQLDDLRDVSPPAKIAGTVLAASLMSIAGVSILFFRIPFAGLLSLSPDMSALLTVVWVIGMSTAINYIDGLDGLAAGIVAIAAAALLLYCERLDGVAAIGPENAGPLIAAATLGACLGFLPHNFHPARIMMGDAGALLLGLLMAAATITVGGNTDTPFSGQTFFFFAPLFIPLVILGVPIFDTAFSIIRRARRGGNVTVADKDHLHHRLMRLGHGQRRSVLILWTWTGLLSAFVLYPVYTRKGDAAVPVGIAALALVLYTY